LNSKGVEISRTGYQPGGAKPFVDAVAKLTGVSVRSSSNGTAQVGRRSDPEPDAPLFGGAPPAPPPHYTDLVLKSISGPQNRRFALLNNQTLAPGESARVKLEDREVKVRCIEIRDRSVIVAVDGQSTPREIKLPDPK